MTNTPTTDWTAHLYDADTADDLGIATAPQMAASDYSEAKGENGIFLIDADGDVCPDGSWDSQQAGVRRVYAL